MVALLWSRRIRTNFFLPALSLRLGTIDIRAVTMSLKSGMKLEVANALNILTMLAADRRLSLSLIQCDDLLDVLLDYLDEDFVRSFYEFDEGTDQENFGDGPENVNGGGGIEEMASREYTYAELFDLSLDEMKSVIPKLEDSSSELWLSRRERCLCIVNLLRNFSFMGENQEFLAKHPRFVDVLARTLTVRTKSEMADKWEQRKGGGYVNVREMDILDHRKSVLLILSNIVPFMTLRSTEVATALVALVSDFLRSGPETYYAQVAIEVWSKMSVSYDNRLVLETLDTRRRRWREQEEEDEEEAEGTMVVVALDSFDQTEDGFLHIERIWAELATAIRRDYFDAATGRVVPTIHSTQLAVLEMAMMGLYNIAVLSRDERTKARLVRRERGVAMMVLRLCVMLAETGNNGFSMVCRRGVELVRALVAGGDGGKRRSTDMEEVAGAGLRRKSRGRGTAVMAGLINVASLSEMLMQAMLRGMMERDILQELWDLVTVVDAAE
ncbi:hypothetical protein BC936DRAFT_143556 [Jimgerdemannia flammicorona]|uniref:Uncharacterized protein n=2 Tax=Jimgerdemannia flammicorona TaxID=994334 RepID=A0A433PXQ4_9FUNG|nr:hypothetical protein BC936DRAFT_143556 [Jimgerdemannia flammicorona]RUS22331.1 hypothetical protein BC938DRAFT_475261 [Jimgerdemannia flammicorona]